MADVTSKGSDQIVLMCSLIRAFICHQCHADGSHMTWLICSARVKVFNWPFDVNREKATLLSVLKCFPLDFQFIVLTY